MTVCYQGTIRVLACLLSFLAVSCLCEGQILSLFEPPFGSPGERVIISGSGFSNTGLIVRFGGPNGAIDGTARATSPTIIWATVPPGATTGPVYVQVNGVGRLSVQDFQVLGLGPFITGFTPRFGTVNQQITIQGWHLTNVTAVRFGGRNSTAFQANANGDQINARVPAGATNGPITVVTKFGTSNSLDSFTVIGPGPYVDSFEPQVGAAGTRVTIQGVQFTKVTNVMFGARSGVNLRVQSDTQLFVDAPPGVETCLISARSPEGRHTNAAHFFVPPVVSGFSPANGRAGTNIVITGTNFLGTMSVLIGTRQAQVMSSTNNTLLVVQAPAGNPSGAVRVNAPAGAAITLTNFTYLPLITNFTPVAGSTGTVMTIRGENLNERLMAVRIGGVAATTNAPPTANQVTVVVPAGASNGVVSITTSNGTHTTPGLFYFPPTISGVSPSNGAPLTIVTVRGANLLGATNVTFNGQDANFSPAETNTQFSVQVPEHVITGPVQVRTPGGVASFGTFYGAPRIASFSPTNGLPGDTITIAGTNFQGVSSVAFNGRLASSFTVGTNGGSISAQVPIGASSGPISVTGPAGTHISSSGFVVNLSSDIVTTLTAAPSSFFTGSNFLFTVFVTNAGPSDAVGVKIETTLPSSLKVLSNVVTQGTVSIQGNQVKATIGSLHKDAGVSLKMFVSPQHTQGTIAVQAAAASDFFDPDPANNDAEASILVLPLPILTMTKYSANQWRLAWPQALSDFQLQYSRSLAATSWSNIATTPTVSGTNVFVVEPATESLRLYRLRK